MAMSVHKTEFATDILRGAEAIAEFLFGSPDERRKVYHLAATSRLPTLKLGSMICARKSVLLKWIEDQESGKGSDGLAPKICA
ncbi:MAG: hypothetical protein ACP5QR_08225 [Rhizomicrobium sp.]